MPKDEEARASLPGTRRAKEGLPGAWQAAMIAALSALAVGYWARPGNTAADADAAATISRVAEVAPQDIAAALDTVAGPRDLLAKFQELESCKRRLAWVTIMRSPGQPPGRIRLQSGGYLSPAFDLTDTPLRVALPYPAPYATGHGTITVLGTTADAIVALTPPWHVPAQAGVHTRQVTWSPVGDCPVAPQ